MANQIGTEIQVRRRIRDGWHVYTCDVLPGLYVASKDDKTAYNDLPQAIATLIKLDLGQDVSVTHKVDYDTFMRQLFLADRAKKAVDEAVDDFLEDLGQTTLIPFVIGMHQGGDGHPK
ncbi:MAG TPA: hypothetical protein VEK55_12385 [Xanthobacteraceae bacterium]|nr:hypothetical protein [Xanthobacteraceae bacterium]